MSDVPLPTDVLARILSRLPVRSLLRFRSVSKSFHALIDSPYLINLHLNHSAKSNSHLNLMFGGDRSLSYLNLDSPTNTVTKIDNPLYFAIFETVVLGACNGVLCLCTTEPDNEVAFWNPVVRKFKKVRLSPAKCIEGYGRGICIKGYGYDHVNDEYKVVRLVQYRDLFNEIVHSSLEVYGTKRDGWREVEGGFPYHVCYRRNFNVFCNGCLHWLVSKKPDRKLGYMIVEFDLVTDELRLIVGPEFGDGNVRVSLGVLGGCLCVVCNDPKMVDVWIMKGFGDKKTWIKLISSVDVKLVLDLDFLRPIVYSKSGREVLLEKNFERLYWYDLENKTVKRLKVKGMPRLFISEVFNASLVQVKIGSESGSGKKKVKVETKNEKKRDDFLSKGFRLVL
ncbi:F-box protein CPR1-like [Rutidosis leptorrhynchoides]|uniref:F-box protein CPR1-like n=1 Tax=Rutidosis leptorrhynchoides TaxID=125765 RepID=UPI003A999789